MNAKNEKALKEYLKDKIRLFGGKKKARELYGTCASLQSRDEGILLVLVEVDRIINEK